MFQTPWTVAPLQSSGLSAQLFTRSGVPGAEVKRTANVTQTIMLRETGKQCAADDNELSSGVLTASNPSSPCTDPVGWSAHDRPDSSVVRSNCPAARPTDAVGRRLSTSAHVR